MVAVPGAMPCTIKPAAPLVLGVTVTTLSSDEVYVTSAALAAGASYGVVYTFADAE